MTELDAARSADLTRSVQNRAAGRLVAAARRASGLSQKAFAEEIGRRLGMPGFSQSTLSGWETSQRAVPAAVLLAATEVAYEVGLSCVLPPSYTDLPVPATRTGRMIKS